MTVTITKRNYVLMAFIQFYLALLFLWSSIWLNSQFRYYALLQMRLGQKLFYCSIIQINLAICLYFIRYFIGLNMYLWDAFYAPFLDWEGNDDYMRALKALQPTLYFTYWMFPNTPPFFQFCILLFTWLSCYWLMNHLYVLQIKYYRSVYRIRRIFHGIIPGVTYKDMELFTNRNIRLTNKVLGFGTYGTTFLCGQNDKPKNELAIKIIDLNEWFKNRYAKKLNQDIMVKIMNIITAFRTTEITLRALDHDNVIKYTRTHHEGQGTNRLYFIMPLARMNLDHFLSKIKPNGVDEDWARDWSRQLCHGLQYLHTQVKNKKPLYHCNIKPENILLFPSGTQSQTINERLNIFAIGKKDETFSKDSFILKLTDPGFESFLPLGGKVVTKTIPPINISSPDKVFGKGPLRYMKFNENQCMWPFDDIYSLGVIIILLMNGDIYNLVNTPVDVDHYNKKVAGVDSFHFRFHGNIFKSLPKTNQMSFRLKHLLKEMLKFHSLLRCNLDFVIKHKWFTEPIAQTQ